MTKANSGKMAQYFTGIGVSAKTRAELKDSRYTEEEYIRAAKSIAAYTITFALNEAHMAVEYMVRKLRGHRLCTYKCYGPMLNKLEAYDQMRRTQIRISEAEDDRRRIDVVLPLIHEDMEENLTRMFYTAKNWYNRWRHPEADIMAAAQMAQLVNDFACNIIEARVREIRKIDANWCQSLDLLKPTKVCRIIETIMGYIVEKTIDPGPEANINDCRELHYGIHVMEDIVSNVDTMELYVGYGIEQTKGGEYLKQELPDVYYRLHPTESPEWQARKAQRELEEQLAQERDEAERLAYTTADIAAVEAKEGMTLEEMFAQKGWSIKR